MVRQNIEESPDASFYHNGGGMRAQYIDPADRTFIGWDGEGQNLQGDGKPQSYVLYGCSTGDFITSPVHLDTVSLCRFMVSVARKYPHAYHVGFAFNYDTNMIVRSLSPAKLHFLYENQYVRIQAEDEIKYTIRICRGKWLSISETRPAWDRKKNPNAKTTIRIYDIFGFFMTSFVSAVESMLGKDTPGLDKVREGKKHRGGTGNCPICGTGRCVFDDIAYVEEYWKEEIKLLARVADQLRERFYSAGFKITQWYGPGALASFTLKKRGIKQHLSDTPNEVKHAAQIAYAGGRFELYKVGRITGPIYSYDINSAYPYAISMLPSLSNGDWRHISRPKQIERFGVYRVRLSETTAFQKAPGPLFHRDRQGNISYPWYVDGWYWSPEVHGIFGNERVEVIEGWEYWTDSIEHPFEWVRGMYKTRQQWKAAGNVNQYALKLTLNSLYGKMAQRVGWDPIRKRIPPWHQLEWAGWVTSYTRAKLYRIMQAVPFDSVIAVETDGIYTTTSPEELKLESSTELGGWEIQKYDEIIYVQSGLAWLRKGDVWEAKRRGLDPDTFRLQDATKYVENLEANKKWEPFVGKQTRFIGLGAALMSKAPLKSRHCVWSTTDKEIVPGATGKRIHLPPACAACRAGVNAYEMPHDLVIRSLSAMDTPSQPHFVPWLAEGDMEPAWMDMQRLETELVVRD